MEENELASEEVDVLLEALAAWEDKDASGNLLGSLLSAMLTDKNPEAMAKAEEQQKAMQAKADLAKRIRHEQSVMLQAKLMHLRPRRIAEGVDAALRRTVKS